MPDTAADFTHLFDAIGPALDSQAAADSQQPNESNDIAKYQEEQSGLPPQQIDAAAVDDDGELSTPWGMKLREARRSLKTGEEADGLLITTVEKGSPAAAAGLHPYNTSCMTRWRVRQWPARWFRSGRPRFF